MNVNINNDTNINKGTIKLTQTLQFKEFARILTFIPIPIINIIYEYVYQPLILYYINPNYYIHRLTIIDDQQEDIQLVKFQDPGYGEVSQLQCCQDRLFIHFKSHGVINFISQYDILNKIHHAGFAFFSRTFIAKDVANNRLFGVKNDGIILLKNDGEEMIINHNGRYQHCVTVSDGIFLFQYKENLYEQVAPGVTLRHFDCAFFNFADYSLSRIASLPGNSLTSIDTPIIHWAFALDDYHVALLNEERGYVYSLITNSYEEFDWKMPPKYFNPKDSNIELIYYDDTIYAHKSFGPPFKDSVICSKRFIWYEFLKSRTLPMGKTPRLATDDKWSQEMYIKIGHSKFAHYVNKST